MWFSMRVETAEILCALNLLTYIYKWCSTKKLNATKRDWFLMSSVRRQKGQPQNRCYKKRKQAKFSKKRNFLPLIRTRNCAYQGVRNIRFPENLMCFVFVTPVLRFAFLPYYWRVFHISHNLLVKEKEGKNKQDKVNYSPSWIREGILQGRRSRNFSNSKTA